MDPGTRFQPNESRIASRVIEDEAILIDLESGTYYCIAGVGSIIWQMLDARMSLEEIGLSVSERYGVERDDVSTDIEAFLNTLHDEGLVEVSRETSARSIPPKNDGVHPEYAAPKLTAHRDMAKLLALDPPTPGGAQEFLWRDPDQSDTSSLTP